MDNQLISIVIPVYRSEDILPILTSNICKAMKKMKFKYEIILVCDASPDLSWLTIKKLSKKFPQIKGLLLRTNVGQHNALMAGFSKARGEIIVTMDDDLQHSPEDSILLINKIKDGYDVAYGKFKKRNHSRWKVLGSFFNNLIASFLLKKPLNLYFSPFRAFSSEIKDDILLYHGPFCYIDGLIFSCTKNIASVEINHFERRSGSGSYGLKKSISLYLRMTTGFSIFPLRLSSFLGFFFSITGFILAFYFLLQKLLYNNTPQGWTSLIIVVLIVAGIQMLLLGVIGEYVGRIFLTLNGKKQYSISKIV